MNTFQRSLIWRSAALAISVALATSANCADFPHGLDLAGIDHSIKPGDNFFAYANGTWIKATEIPPDRSNYSIGAMLVELTNKRTAALLQEADAQGAEKSAELRKI